MDEACFKKYLKQALVNESLFVYLFKLYQTTKDRKVYVNWLFVAAYYAALHYFYAFMICKGKNEAGLPERHFNYQDCVVGDGDVEMARGDFWSADDKGNADAVGEHYVQLYYWSCDVRYSPNKYDRLGEEEMRVALCALKRVKCVVENESGYVFQRIASEVVLSRLMEKNLPKLWEQAGLSLKDIKD